MRLCRPMRSRTSTRALGRASNKAWLIAAVFLAACHLLTEGQGDSPADSEDAGSSTSPASECDLVCALSAHCELQGKAHVCVPDDLLPKNDAGSSTQPPPPSSS